MNNLVNIQDGKVVVSSRMVAEKFEREHRNVTASIREILGAEKLASSLFEESTFEYRGQDFTEYIMGRDGFSLLVMGFTGSKALSWKLKYIQAFNEMESQLSMPSLPDFTNPAVAARAWADEVEAKLLLSAEVKAMTPKAEFYDAVTQSDTWFNMQSVAAILAIKGLGRNNLFTFLVKHGILIDTVTPYRTQIDNGNFKVVEGVYVNPKTGVNVVSKKVVVSQKGIDAVRRLYYGKS